MKQKKKTPNDYPKINLRIDSQLLKRVNEAKDKAGISYAQLIRQALVRYLPDFEKFHAQ